MSCVLKRKARPSNNYKDGRAPHEISSIQRQMESSRMLGMIVSCLVCSD